MERPHRAPIEAGGGRLGIRPAQQTFRGQSGAPVFPIASGVHARIVRHHEQPSGASSFFLHAPSHVFVDCERADSCAWAARVAAMRPAIAIASRASELALWQSNHVRVRLLQCHPDLAVEIVAMTTLGDRVLDRSLAKIGGKGLFVKELENALEAGRARIAVHSMKDVPMELPAGFAIGAVLVREDPLDAFVSNAYAGLASLPPGARVGTSSLRREAQLRARFPALAIVPVRGNVPSRLRKLDAGEFDALILAAAGLKRLGLQARIRETLSAEASIPAPGQGALGIECRSDDSEALRLVAPLQDPATACAVAAERTVSRLLGGSCQVPLGAYAECDGTQLRLRAFVATADGRRLIRAEASGGADTPEAVGTEAARSLRAQGADAVLAAAATSG